MDAFSPQELSDFYRYIGREIDIQYITAGEVRYAREVEHDDQLRGARYSQRVWSKHSRADYIARHAVACAQFASNLTGDSVSRTYLLADQGGRPSFEMGYVHFRTIPYCPSAMELQFISDKNSRFPIIESIVLHPSLRRNGFFSALLEAMKSQGFAAVGIGNIANPSWAYHLYQKSLVSSQVVLLSAPGTVEFSTKVSPIPTFGLRI